MINNKINHVIKIPIQYEYDFTVKSKNFIYKAKENGDEVVYNNMGRLKNHIFNLVKSGIDINIKSSGNKDVFPFFEMSKNKIVTSYNIMSNFFMLDGEDAIEFEQKLIENYKIRSENIKISTSWVNAITYGTIEKISKYSYGLFDNEGNIKNFANHDLLISFAKMIKNNGFMPFIDPC